MKDQIKKVFGKIIKETPSKLSTKALKRANKINKLNAGTLMTGRTMRSILRKKLKIKIKPYKRYIYRVFKEIGIP